MKKTKIIKNKPPLKKKKIKKPEYNQTLKNYNHIPPI